LKLTATVHAARDMHRLLCSARRLPVGGCHDAANQ